MEGGFIPLDKFEVYLLAREYSRLGWKIYTILDWRIKKVIGDQMITSVDSVGANIAEGYGRYHFLDKNKFYYNARGSLLESQHWVKLLLERSLVSRSDHDQILDLFKVLEIKLNTIIRNTRNASTISR